MRIVAYLFGLSFIAVILGLIGVFVVVDHYGRSLPEYAQLSEYETPVTTRVHAGDGSLLAEFATERRVFVPITDIPERVKEAFLSAEDKNFYTHHGLDMLGIVRAAITNIRNYGKDRRLVGASTITQQVAKNFLLSNEVTFDRKLKEAILANRIDSHLPKDKILELYLNEIYLGYGSYGVAAAALNYFNKPLEQLSVAEAAFLAALPKAPNNYDPVDRHEAAVARRNWVIGRMQEDGHIDAEAAAVARATPLTIHPREMEKRADAKYFAEEVRRVIARSYGEDALYKGGLTVHATVSPDLQDIANQMLRDGLRAYDRRHGWRGPITRLANIDGTRESGGEPWTTALNGLEEPAGLGSWRLGVVLGVDADGADIGLKTGETGRMPFSAMSWARQWLEGQRIGAAPRQPSDVLSLGDVIAVDVVEPSADEAGDGVTFALRQIPEVEGALIAIDPHTGRVLAMSGGYAFARSEFNRATQALRQPGSAFKPMVYLAAMEQGYTPSSIVLDAPFVMEQGGDLPVWNPANYSKRYYGPTTLRVGLEKSRNVMTVRLAQQIGMPAVVDVATRFNIFDQMPPYLSYALGAGETTLLRLTTAYAMLVNGGKRIEATLIDRIQDRYGRIIYRHDDRDCPGCQDVAWSGQPVPEIADDRQAVTDPHSAYQIVSMLRGVVLRGTGRRVNAVGKPLAGKTGTSNEAKDTWFIGFSPDLVVGVFVGFDEPTPLGPREAGSTVAAPIFRDFMKIALADAPATPFRIPPGIRLVRVNANTGRVAQPGDRNVIFEAFKPGSQPPPPMTSPETAAGAPFVGPSTGTGGLY